MTDEMHAARLKERQRMAAILMSDEAKGRQRFALHLAAHTDMPPDEAKALLSAAACEVEETPSDTVFPH